MTVALPPTGTPRDELFAKLDAAGRDDMDWKSARMFAFIYRVEDEVIQVGKDAYARFQTENGLSPFAFPSLRKFETEVISMTCDMLHGGPEACGSMTSGGTESILMAVKAAREWAREKYPHITEPEMIICSTAHPAWNKACHYLGLKCVITPMTEGFRADPAAFRAAITSNTIMLIGSAPSYPHGTVDPIAELGDIAEERGLWLHVDACVGGFVLPFAASQGYPIPAFDFAVPGVLSISADVHKYGYAPKGASTVLYRNADYRRHQFYVFTEWPGGVYGTPALAGGRPGGAVAASWAVMNYLGREGYERIVKVMMETTKAMIAGVNKIPGLRVMGTPESTLFAIASDNLNIFALGDEMKKRNWHIEPQHLPASLHLTVSPKHGEVLEEFLKDLREAAEAIKDLPESDLSEAATMYGMMGTMPDRNMAHDLALAYLDGLYKVGG
jgi:sphinganine-1-phosphate aldolase